MPQPTRRTVLKEIGRASMALPAASWVRRALGQPAHDGLLPPTPAMRPETDPIAPEIKSIVAHAQRDELVDEHKIHVMLLREMIDDCVRTVTGAARAADGWRRLLHADDVIGIKFNQVGFERLQTSDLMAEQLVTSLGEAGFAPERIMLIEAPESLARRLRTRPRVFGFSGPEIDFGSGKEQLSAVLQEVTAIINVPFLKTHNIAGMTGCLKNLSHSLIRHPSRYHANGCAPFVADIVGLEPIRTRLRLNIINAVRAVYRKGPDVLDDNVWNHCGLIASTDPVAADAVGIDVVNDHRALVGLPPVGNAHGQVAHVQDAAEKGIGTDDQDYIDLQTFATQ